MSGADNNDAPRDPARTTEANHVTGRTKDQGEAEGMSGHTDMPVATGLAEKTASLTLDNDKNEPDPGVEEHPLRPTMPSSPRAPKSYLDPTPKTPALSRQPSTRASDVEYDEKSEEYTPVAGTVTEKTHEVASDNDSSAEIQSIMDQFTDGADAPSKEEIMSPKHETGDPMLGAMTAFPPRRTSLEPLRSRDMDAIAQSPVEGRSERLPTSPPPVPPKGESDNPGNPLQTHMAGSTASLPKQLPEPEPEPELPFDFHRFLEQLRHKSADPVAKFLRSFLTEFGKKQWMVHEQVKIIGDFLAFITNKMALCDVWREVSDNEFDNAKEGMEKLVMNRLYSQTFSPAIPPSVQLARSRSRGKKRDLEKDLGPGRRGQHQEDVERDEILAQKIRIYSWVREVHLDIAPVGPNGERFLRLAQQELLKIKGYRAPRDKVICILNCCKVIFGLLKNAESSDTSADSFVPLLIYVVLQANPEHMVSNIQYILRFRNQDKLSGEAGYYLSSLSGAIQFIESLDRTTLTVSDDDFEKHVELAVSAIAEQNKETEATHPRHQLSEKSPPAGPEVTRRDSVDVISTSPRKSRPRESRSGAGSSTDVADEEPSVAGLLRTIQKPLSSIGRMFSDQDATDSERSQGGTPQRRLSPARLQSTQEGPITMRQQGQTKSTGQPVASYDAQEAAVRQASAEAAEARRIQRAEHKTVVDTLCGMFPNLDRDIIDDVVRQKQGRVGLAVDACLNMTAGG